MMKTFALILLSTFIFGLETIGQRLQTDEIAKKEILKLSFMCGEWKGNGWIMGQNGERQVFSQTEMVRFKLDSTALLIEGKGIADGRVVHNALGVMRYNGEAGKYSFYTFLSNGKEGVFDAALIDGKIYWSPGAKMNYTLWIDNGGRWIEKGEMDREGHRTQFFETALDKK